MTLRAWFKRLLARNGAASKEAAAFPVAGFWRSVCCLKQPILLVRGGLNVLAASEEAYDLFGCRNLEEICALIKEGVDVHTLNRVQMAIMNPVAIVTELPIRVQKPGIDVNFTISVSTLPEYPDANTALLFLKDNRSPAIPAWAKTARDLLSRLPFPSWVVDAAGAVVFSNASFTQFPMERIRAELAHENVVHDPVARAQMARMLRDFDEQPDNVRSLPTVTDRDYDIGAFGQWRVTHFPLKNTGGERMVGVLTMPLDCCSHELGLAVPEEEPLELMGHDALTHVLQVREAERAALAREVHDSLGQELTFLKLEMHRLQTMVLGTAAGTPAVLDHLVSVRRHVDKVASTARRIAYEMRQDLAVVQGLSHSVQTLVRDLRERIGLQVQFELLPGWVEPEKSMAHNMHRSVQEMLNNVSKHAKATRCLVRMGLKGNTYWLEVRDDGVGMPPDVSMRSIGLRSLAERAGAFHGTVAIRTRPEVEGTSVRIELVERRAQRVDGAMAPV